MVNDLQHQEDVNRISRPLGRLVALLNAKGVLTDEEVELVINGGADIDSMKEEMGKEDYEELNLDSLENDTIMEWWDELRALDSLNDSVEN